MCDLTFDRPAGFQDIVDRSYDLIECDLSVDLCTAIVGCDQSALVFYESRWQQIAPRVIQRRANARCTDIETKNEILSQRFETVRTLSEKDSMIGRVATV